MRLFFVATVIFLVLAAKSVGAALLIPDPASSDDPAFYEDLQNALAILERSDDPYMRQLHAAVRASAALITFRKITNDRSTWSSNGDPERGHTEPTDGRPKNAGRTTATEAIVFIPPSAVKEGSGRWQSGLLVHELVHALDLTNGFYNHDYRVRERRATFFQNLWRHDVGYRLRASYHGQFPTLDYQCAAQRETIAEYVQWIFSRGDFPKPPSAAEPSTSTRK